MNHRAVMESFLLEKQYEVAQAQYNLAVENVKDMTDRELLEAIYVKLYGG